MRCLVDGCLVFGPTSLGAGYGGFKKLNLDLAQQNEKETLKPRVIPSDQLFNGSQEILIEHGRVTYRLLITKAGKLILNK